MHSSGCSGAVFAAFGSTFRLASNDPEVALQMASRALALGWTRSSSTSIDAEFVLRRIAAAGAPSLWLQRLECNGRVLHGPCAAPEALDAFENHAKIEMAYRAADYLFVHAGVVGWRGGAIVMPGRSYAGKTTLVAALVERGAEYYSDEFALIDRDGLVWPYPVPLSVRHPDGTSTRMTVESLGGRAGRVALPVRLIAVTQYRRAARWRPKRLSSAEAMLALMDNTVAATRPPADTMPILRTTALAASSVRSLRCDARRTAAALLEIA